MADETDGCPVHNTDGDLSDLVPYGEGITYNDYLKIPELTRLQEPLSDPPHHDEMLFIIIHQAYELWFKLILHELESTRNEMENGHMFQANHHLERSGSVMELLVKQIHMLETMRPADFLQFRHNLEPASGFQSLQFREMEFMLGLKNEQYLKFFEDDSEEFKRLDRRLHEPDLRETYYDLLKEEGFSLPENTTIQHLEEDESDREHVFEGLKEIYQNPEQYHHLYRFTESLVTLDEQLGLWRDHHVRVVERIIGSKTGTGGSSGVYYLKSTTDKRCFPFLWEVRTHIERDN